MGIFSSIGKAISKVASPVAAVAGGILGYMGADKAADASEDAAKESAALQLGMYNQTRLDQAPWREAGGEAINKLNTMLDEGPGEFEESPGYRFTLNEGLDAQQNALSAMGKNRSGSHIKAATDYATGAASTEYDNFLNRYYQRMNPLLSVAGFGQQSVNSTGQYGSGAAARAGEARMYGGGSESAGYINKANVMTTGMRDAANQLSYWNQTRNLPPANTNYVPPGSGYTAYR